MRQKSGIRNLLGLLAAVSMLAGPALAWMRLVPAIVGFVLFALGGVTALLVGIASIVQAVRGRGMGLGGRLAAVAGAAFVIIAIRGRGGPMINDFTTDAANPPAFRHAATLPPNAGRDLGYPAAFAEVQRECCADLRPARVPLGKAEAFAKARGIAERTPSWKVTATDPEAGTIEAVATSRLFGFQDDIVIRVREEGPGTSRIDIRSKSRDGRGDMGVNAARIHAFIAEAESAAK